MKTVSLFFLFFFLISCSTPKVVRKISSEDYPAELSCELKTSYGQSDVQKCRLKTGQSEKEFFLFKGEGTLEEIQFAHGYLLAKEINQGTIEEMLYSFERESKAAGKSRFIFEGLKSCHMGYLKKSVSQEFMKTIAALYQGYSKGLADQGLIQKFTEEDFIFTLLGIEVGNVLSAVSHQVGEKPLKILGQVARECGLKVTQEGLKQLWHGLQKNPPHDQKLGCVGLVAPDSVTGQGLLHGRNLDQTPLIKSWSKYPVIYLLKENGHIPYVAAGTAGLIYPGGISGFNQHGISVSLHQMNTTRYDTKYPAGSAEVVPFLQQRILREAKSIDEAWKIIKKTNIFSSWTIFISDSKPGVQEVASIEVSAKRKVIARRRKNEIMAQSNHYIDPSMQQEHLHGNLAAYLETQSRLLQMEKVLNNTQKAIDVDWAMEALSSHQDYYEGERSFGRTAVKLSNIMSSIAHPARNEFWMTVGDRKPAAHSWYAGVRVDFTKMNLDVISMNKSFNFEARPHLEESYSHSVLAYTAYKDHENKKALNELETAYKLAKKDGVEDTSYMYNLARLHLMENNPQAAKPYLDKLYSRKAEFHPYHQALVMMYLARTDQLLGQTGDEIKSLYDNASGIFQKFIKESQYQHGVHDLKKKIKLISKWSQGEDADIPNLDFSVVD